MRIPSGKTDQYIYFVAQLGGARVTGLSSFTVYRSRNGAAAAAFTTPTVNETDVTNMPGVYELLMDEDTNVASGSDSEEMALHITKTGMDPVTRVVELYRRTVTTGETLTVSSGAVSTVTTTTTATNVTTVNGLAAGVITATSIAADAITDAKVASDVTIASVTGAVGSVTGNVGGNITGSVGSVATGGITAASFAADAITAAKIAADVTTEFQAGLATAANLATVAGYLDTEIAAILADTNELQTDWVNGGRLDLILDARASQTSVDDLPTNAELATALGTADDAVLAQVALVKAKTDLIPASPAATGDIPTSDITAIKAKTDSLTFTVAGNVDANIQRVNDVAVAGTGALGDEWGPV